MVTINWDEYKEYKKYSHKDDNFAVLLDFIASYYKITHPGDIYEIMESDNLSKMMLTKRDIADEIGLEDYIYKLRHG